MIMDLLKRISLALLMLCITTHSNAVANQTLIRTRTRLEEPKNHGGFFAFAFSPDGKTIAGGTGVLIVSSDNRESRLGCDVLLWNARSGKLLRSLGQHGDSVNWVAFSQDGRTLVSASRGDGTIKVWQMPAGRLRHTLKIDAAARLTDRRWPQWTLSGDSRTLVTISARVISVAGGGRLTTGGELIVWDLDSGKKRWSKPNSDLYTAALTADGRGMVGVLRKITDLRSEGKGSVQYRAECALQSWNVETGDVLESVDLGRESAPEKVALLDGDKTVAWFTLGGLSFRDRLTGEVKHEIKWHKELLLGDSFLSADGKTVGRTNSHWLELIDLATGQSRGLLTTEFPNNVGPVYFSADLKRAVGSWSAGFHSEQFIFDLVHATVALPKTDRPDLP
jgi:WD40 repeat protein